MFKKILKIAIAAALAPVGAAYAQETDKLAALEERISELEANSSLNIFNFRGTFITRYDDVSISQDKPSAIDHKNLSYLRMRFSLDADASISQNVKFFSRFTTSKHFNTWTTTGTASAAGSDLRAADSYLNSSVVLEKAYLDMSIPNSDVTVSVGRLPTPDGQPANYWDGRARLGTYPLMSYSSVLDGIALTYRLDQFMPEGHKLAARGVYSPFSSYTIGNYLTPPTHNNAGGADPATKELKDFYTLQLDYSTSAFGFADNFGFIVQHNSLSPINVAGATAGSSTLKFGLKATTVAMEFNGLAGLPLDVSLSHLMSEIHSLGQLSGLGYGTTTADAKTRGSISLLSTRYRLSSWLIGLEYGKGTKGVFYSGGTAEDLTNMYGTPGDLYHGYVTKKFTDNLSLRLGYYQQNEKYSRIALGNISESDRKIDVGYANFRADF